ncbi:MAG: DUF5067 domain-containing protein [Lachnospiraceae bacterium]
MDTNNQEFYEDEEVQEIPVRKKKKKKGLIIFLVILILVIAGGAGYYFYERQKPIETTKDYLENMRAMNFDGMKALLQSNDMSALDDADITSNAYTSFFKKINEKMSYKITKTSFHIQNGTASVTAHIRYIDGANIYKETITEFLKQIVSTAFSGSTLTEEETEQKLATLLEEKSSTVEDKFTETDITYPVIEADGQWKIVTLDADTVRVMSANFTNVQDEIDQSLADLNNPDATAESAAPSSTTSIDMENDHFTLKLTQFRIAQEIDDSNCLMLYCDYTNNAVPLQAHLSMYSFLIAERRTLSPAVQKKDESSNQQLPLQKLNRHTRNDPCYAFSLNDKSDVTLEASEAFAFGDGNVTSQTIKLQ